MLQLVYDIMPYAIMFTAPLLLAALGGLISERSGVVNIALEGIMIVGSFVSAIIINLNYSGDYSLVWYALLLSGLAGMAFSLLHAFASISLSANQVISGTALNLLAPALTIFLAKKFTGTQNVSVSQGVKRVTYEGLGNIPFIGKVFFTNTYMTSFLTLVVLIIVWYIVFKTRFGLRLRACGENPSAADSLGINVYKMRYVGVLASGFLAGLAGGVYVLTIPGQFTGEVAGFGFLALAGLIFGKWKPFLVLGACFFFAFTKTLATVSPVNATLQQLNLPMEFYNAIPYVVTIIALVLFANNTVGPKASGEPYDKGKR
ncbi:MAG: ABC transporter permease [Lachnospirales bacterium]